MNPKKDFKQIQMGIEKREINLKADVLVLWTDIFSGSLTICKPKRKQLTSNEMACMEEAYTKNFSKPQVCTPVITQKEAVKILNFIT